MFGQTFQTADLASVFALVVLEALLSADNALVLAIMVRHLKKEERQRALLYGLAGAFVFRLIAILLANIVLEQWWLQAVGALYLLWLPIKHFVAHAKDKEAKPVGLSFWRTVIMVELTDIAFAVDSVLAGVTFIDNRDDKIWVVYFGAIIGIILLRFAAGQFVKLLERYPMLDHVAYLLVGWVGVKLCFLALNTMERVGKSPWGNQIPDMPHWLFWAVLLTIAVLGTVLSLKNARSDEEVAALEAEHAEILDAQDLQTDEKTAEPERRDTRP